MFVYADNAATTSVSKTALEAMLPFATGIGVNAPMLLYNGAMIYDHRTDETLFAPRIPFETALGIVKRVEEMGLYIQLYPGRGYYCSEIRRYEEEGYLYDIPVPFRVPGRTGAGVHPQ